MRGGFGILEVTVSLAVASIVSLSLMSLIEHQEKSNQRIRTASQSNELQNTLRIVLDSQDACRSILQGFSPQAFPDLRAMFANSEVLTRRDGQFSYRSAGVERVLARFGNEGAGLKLNSAALRRDLLLIATPGFKKYRMQIDLEVNTTPARRIETGFVVEVRVSAQQEEFVACKSVTDDASLACIQSGGTYAPEHDPPCVYERMVVAPLNEWKGASTYLSESTNPNPGGVYSKGMIIGDHAIRSRVLDDGLWNFESLTQGEGDDHYPKYALNRARGTSGVAANIRPGDILGQIHASGFFGAWHQGGTHEANPYSAAIRFIANNTWGQGSRPASIQFMTTRDGNLFADGVAANTRPAMTIRQDQVVEVNSRLQVGNTIQVGSELTLDANTLRSTREQSIGAMLPIMSRTNPVGGGGVRTAAWRGLSLWTSHRFAYSRSSTCTYEEMADDAPGVQWDRPTTGLTTVIGRNNRTLTYGGPRDTNGRSVPISKSVSSAGMPSNMRPFFCSVSYYRVDNGVEGLKPTSFSSQVQVPGAGGTPPNYWVYGMTDAQKDALNAANANNMITDSSAGGAHCGVFYESNDWRIEINAWTGTDSWNDDQGPCVSCQISCMTLTVEP